MFDSVLPPFYPTCDVKGCESYVLCLSGLKFQRTQYPAGRIISIAGKSKPVASPTKYRGAM